jgi:hypothetical protein
VAIYSASVKTISRKAGRSATAAAAYRTGSLVIDERTGESHDYTRKQGVEHVSRHLPHGLVMDTSRLWNAAEGAEKRKDATVARELVVALPHDLSPLQRIALADAIAASLVERYGVAAESAIHAPDAEGDQRNHHSHIQFSTRRMTPDGSFGEKTRELDDIKQGKVEIEWIREMVENKTNCALETAGLEARVDRRSLKDQRAAALEVGDLVKAQELDRAPQIHEGPRVTQIRRETAREGRELLGALDRAAANDALHFDIDADRAELAEVVSMIEHIEKRTAERDGAHGEALQENALRDRLSEAVAQREQVQMAKIDLGIKLSQGKPSYVYEARAQRKEMMAAKAEAKTWREEHRWFAKTADLVGIKLETDKTAEYAIAKYTASPERAKAQQWIRSYEAAVERHHQLGDKLEKCEVRVSRLDAEVKALNSPDPQVAEHIRSETSLAQEHFSPAIQKFVSEHKEIIGGIASGADAWVSTDIARTGDPVLDTFLRRAANLRSRMVKEEMHRVKTRSEMPAPSLSKYERSFGKAFDTLFDSNVQRAKIQQSEFRRRNLTAQKSIKEDSSEYVPSWKRFADDDPAPSR